jgi:23S rRNA pseudouridine1911/1915/1917 synthase
VNRFEVDAAEAGTRLDVLLAARLGWSRSRAASRLEQGLVTVDGAGATKRDRPRAGQVVEVGEPEDAGQAPPPPLPPVRYRDEHLLVVAKPPGLVVHPGPGWRTGTLVDALRAEGIPLASGSGTERPGIVHRLDRDTSGLLVVASTELARQGLIDALRRRAVTRRYLALVEGVPTHPRGRIEGPLGRDPTDRLRFAVVEGGKPAATRYRVVGEAEVVVGTAARPVAALACTLETGRTHQIRVHLSTLGHPVLADTTYGARPAVASAVGLGRVALHAGRLAFDHPVTGARVEVHEPLPDDLDAACRRLGLPDTVADLPDEPARA